MRFRVSMRANCSSLMPAVAALRGASLPLLLLPLLSEALPLMRSSPLDWLSDIIALLLISVAQGHLCFSFR